MLVVEWNVVFQVLLRLEQLIVAELHRVCVVELCLGPDNVVDFLLLLVLLLFLCIEFSTYHCMSLLELFDDLLLGWQLAFEPVVRDDLVNGWSVQRVDLEHAVD